MAASVVASVALPISNNFSFAPSMDAYGKLSEYGKLGAWSPLSLFAASEVGAWYDPSDLTTMFQDSAGTTPVTADGQPVGLILDKSKGLLLGTTIFSEDGASASDWVYPGINGGSVTAVSGEIQLTCGNPLSALTDRLCYSTITGLSIGDTYKATVTFRKITESVGARISVVTTYTTGDANGVYVDNNATVSSEKTLYFVASDTTMYFRLIAINGNSSATVGLSSATIRKIAGNHASQATAASRPLYAATGLSKWVNYDAVDDAMGISFASTLGSNCTIARANVGSSPTILTGQTIGTSYSDSTDNAGLIIINRALTGQETAALTTYLTQMGATT